MMWSFHYACSYKSIVTIPTLPASAIWDPCCIIGWRLLIQLQHLPYWSFKINYNYIKLRNRKPFIHDVLNISFMSWKGTSHLRYGFHVLQYLLFCYLICIQINQRFTWKRSFNLGASFPLWMLWPSYPLLYSQFLCKSYKNCLRYCGKFFCINTRHWRFSFLSINSQFLNLNWHFSGEASFYLNGHLNT